MTRLPLLLLLITLTANVSAQEPTSTCMRSKLAQDIEKGLEMRY